VRLGTRPSVALRLDGLSFCAIVKLEKRERGLIMKHEPEFKQAILIASGWMLMIVVSWFLTT
jgi:hypothetical protein